MIDFHCHILPGIDDGAADVETAVAMLRMAEAHGTAAIVATPHVIEGDWLPDWEEILAKFDTLQSVARENGCNLRLYPGAEIAIHMDLLQRLTGPGAYCINSGKYMLVELPAFEIPGFVDDFLFRIQSRGIAPILAHPERHPVVAEHPELILDLTQRGVLIQVNSSSLVGKMGERVAATAKLLLANQLVHLIGSDAHGVRNRRPRLDEAAALIAGLHGNEMVRRILRDNPERVIGCEKVEIPEVSEIRSFRHDRKWLRWFQLRING